MGMAAVLLAAPYLALAEDAAPLPDFTFKMVKVSDINPDKLIDVQIDPVEQAALLSARPWPEPRRAAEGEDPMAPLAPQPPLGANYDWFWDTVPVAREATADRFDLALAALDNGPDGESVATPRLQTMQNLAEKWGTEVLKATVGTRVSPALVLAVMGIESGGNPDAVSSAGAVGLMQLIPETAARFGVSERTDPVQNIKGGISYLDFLIQRFGGDPVLVLAAYNAGEGAVEANGGVPPYPETRDYVPKVLAAWTVAQGLCMTPPDLISDPCVFRIISASN
jgi:soluble lytic murein transglycosylase-like protein